jgi:SAM-dependent methyltransferase
VGVRSPADLDTADAGLVTAGELKYHQLHARLGIGDLHPGGAPATERLLHWLRAAGVQEVLEVGAGIGNTSGRMSTLGWRVTALEPDAVLHARLQRLRGVAVHRTAFLEYQTDVRYDAIVAESVLFQMDLPRAFAHAHSLLRPGGYLAFAEAVWRADVSATMSARLHDQTQQLFGIAVGSREPMTWRDWSRHLQESGFETVHAEMLPAGAAGHRPTAKPYHAFAALLRDPRLALWIARYRARKRVARMPPGLQESWIFLGRSGAATSPHQQASDATQR